MISETSVQFLALGLGHGERLGMLSYAIPHGFNESDTLLDAKAQDLFKLGWTQGRILRRHWLRCNLYARSRADGAQDPRAASNATDTLK